MRLCLTFLLLLGMAHTAAACFGPKLYLGAGTSVEEEVLVALVSLYVKEKTGTETVLVFLDGRPPKGELQEERLDLALLPAGQSFASVLLAVEGWPQLAAGRRPLQELQFSTVAPALKKLSRLLRFEHLQGLRQQVEAGETAAASARRFLAAQGWI